MTERVRLRNVIREERTGVSAPAGISLKFTHEGQNGSAVRYSFEDVCGSIVGSDVGLR